MPTHCVSQLLESISTLTAKISAKFGAARSAAAEDCPEEQHPLDAELQVHHAIPTMPRLQ